MDVPVVSISPNPTCMYLTQPLKEAVIRFRRAIARKQGLCCILGGNGTGKSSLLRYLSSGYESENTCSVSYINSENDSSQKVGRLPSTVGITDFANSRRG